jgi:putative DNA-invertase from lambdoid prophage Rac
MAKVYGYGRHSTARQSLTEQAQKEKVEDYVGRALAEHEYGGWLYDQQTSGSKPMFERDQGRELWALVQPGDHIVWAKLDRAFRSVIDGATTMDMLAHKGVFVHSLDLGLDTSTPVGRCISTVMIAFAELEREYGRERTREALRSKRERGLPYGIHIPMGWKKVGNKADSRFEVDLEERRQINEIVRMRERGHSYVEIALEMQRNGHRRRRGEWHPNSIAAALQAAESGFPKLPEATS